MRSSCRTPSRKGGVALRAADLALPLIALLLACAALAPLPPAPRLALRALSRDGPVLVDARGYSGMVTVVASLNDARFDDVAYYYDPHYARGRGESDRFAHGFLAHLDDALLARGYRTRTHAVDAGGLRALLAAPPGRTCLVVPGGILPDIVRSAARDDLRAWLLAGGTVIWAGEPFDAAYSGPGGALAAVAVDYAKWPRLYGGGGLQRAESIYAQPVTFASSESAGWQATHVPYVRTTFGVYPARLPAAFSIGYDDRDGRSSVSVFAAGAGHVVLFADALDDEADAARDVAQILFTGVWADRRAPAVAEVPGEGDGGYAVLPPGTRRVVAFGRGVDDEPFAALDLGAPSE